MQPSESGTAGRVRGARDSQAICRELAAQELGISVARYLELEERDDAVWTELTLRELRKLCRFLAIPPSLLLTGARSAPELLSKPEREITDLRRALVERLGADPQAIARASAGLGVQIAPFLEDAGRIWEWKVKEVVSVMTFLCLDWAACIEVLVA